MSALPASLVYTGFWIDWSKGPILGSIITVASSTGAILVAFIALFVSFAGNSAWDIFRFAAYSFRAKRQNADALYWQHQAILRNETSPISLILSYFQISNRWSRYIKNAFVRGLLPVSVAYLCSIGFALAGIYSSRVISTTNVSVLASSPACGLWKTYTGKLRNRDDQLEIRYVTQSVNAQWERSNACYENATTFADCDIYVKPNLSWDSKYNMPCPFDRSVCNSDNEAVQLTTGLLSSHGDFGLNVKPHHRIGLRKRTTCVPLNTDAFSTIIPASDFPGLDRPSLKGEEMAITLFNKGNLHHNGIVRGVSTYESNTTVAYKSSTDTWIPGVPASSTMEEGPIPELRINNADLVLLYIAGCRVNYLQQVDDPIFAAHKKGPTVSKLGGGSLQGYLSDSIISTIGCTEEYQFCNSDDPNSAHCTPWDSIAATHDNLEKLPTLTSIQNATVHMMHQSIYQWGLDISLGSENQDYPLLKAQEKLQSNGLSLGLPDDQWIREVEHWEALVMSSMQQFFADYGTGPSQPYGRDGELKRPPNTDAEKKLCKAQIMKTNGSFNNISVLGLGIVMGLGGIIILSSLLIPETLIFLNRRSLKRNKEGMPRIQAWVQDGTLNLQKVAYQGLGYRAWADDKPASTVPVLERERELPTLCTISGSVGRVGLGNGGSIGGGGGGSVSSDGKVEEEGEAKIGRVYVSGN